MFDINDASICMDGSLLIHTGGDGSLVVWNMDSQKELGRLVGHDADITAVAARGNLAVSAQDSGPHRIWNLETMQCATTLPGMHDTFSLCCMEGRVLLGSVDGPIQLWDIAASAPVALPDLEGHTEALYSIKASDNMVLSSSEDSTARLWDLRTGRCVRTMDGHCRTAGVWSVDMDGYCHTAVSGSSDKTVKLWDLGSGRCCATLQATRA